MEFHYEEKWKYLTDICLNITDACNLKCKYCFVTQQPHFIELQTAKDIVDWLINNLIIKKEKKLCDENAKIYINFFGGEPMLLYDEIIVPLTNYLEENYKNLYKLGMTTNGTLLSEDRIKWLKNHNFAILLSIDGDEFTQNYNRPCQNENQKSFDLILPNIPTLLEAYPETTFRSTIDQDTASHTFENYLFAKTLGFKNIFMIPNGREKWSQEHFSDLNLEVQKIFSFIQENYENNCENLNCSIIDEAFKEVKQQITAISSCSNILDREAIRNVARCGLGTVGGSIAYDGSIYGCQEQDSHNADNTIFYLGNIYKNGIEIERHVELLKKYMFQGTTKSENRELCYSCLLKNQCMNFHCPSCAIDCFDDFSICPESYCVWKNLLFSNALKVTMYLFSQNNKNFIKYFNQLK